jgi:APA family basic amino acid/polyamine antiporter
MPIIAKNWRAMNIQFSALYRRKKTDLGDCVQLKKGLNLLDVFCITSGAMMSSGLFLLPGIAFAQVGPAVIIAYLLAGALATTGMLSQAELASAMPKSGGTYFYVTRSMGSAVGTVYGLITLLALALKSAFELIGMAAFTVLIISLDIHIIAAALCVVIVLFNIIGIKEVGRLQIGLVVLISLALAMYVIRGLNVIDLTHFQPFAPEGLMGIIGTAGFVFMSYGGLLKIASVAEEIKDPGRILPLGMILSLLFVAAFYTLTLFVTIGVLNSAQLQITLTPISDAAAVFMGTSGKIIMGIVAIMGFASAASAGIMGASRYPLALSRDNLFPRRFGKINERFGTPHIAILFTGAIVIIALFFKINIIVKAASSVLILTYIFSCLALIILRESHLQNYQPKFKAPLYPYVQIIGIVGFGFLLYKIGSEALIVNLLLVISGFFVYWFYGRIRTTREYALLHIIERITAKEITTHSLETELKEIIKERDEIIKDRFDEIIEKCTILDIEKSTTIEEFSQLAASEMARHLNKDSDSTLNLLLAREHDASVVLTPHLAIPHIIIDGTHSFDILLARCKGGVYFSESAPKVHAVFVLMGTRDERTFHLRVLAAIAQIIMDPHFDDKWMKARSKEALRDIVLLGKRRR